MKNTRKWIVTVLVIVVLLGGVLAVWRPWQQPKESGGSWTWNGGTVSTAGAISDKGYYYVPRASAQVLTFYDFATGVNVSLCSRVACEHDTLKCDAYMFGVDSMVFHNEHLYYVDYQGALCRRDATGMALLKIGTPGKQFIAQEKAVSVGNLMPVGNWLYYLGTVSSREENEEGIQVTLKEMQYIGRIHLITGRDEVLLEEKNNNTLRLCAVQNGSVLVNRHEIGGLNREDEDYLEQLRQADVTLERWDEETGEVTVLFRKKRQDCLEIQMLAGNQLYCLTTGVDGSRGDNYIYDLETGEETQLAENASYLHLGGGYAFRTIGKEKRELVNLATGEILYNGMYELTDIATPVVTMSSQGVVLQYIVDFGDGTGEIRQGYVAYDSLADGLQVADLQMIYARETNISSGSSTTQPTDPTEPTEPGKVTEKPDSAYMQLPFDDPERIPDEDFEFTVQYLPETVPNPQGLPVLKWVCLMEGSKQVWTEDAVHELNQQLADRDMPFRVQFVMVNTPSYMEAEIDWFSRPAVREVLKDADLIFGGMAPEARQEYLMPITEYATGEAQPSLKNAVPHALNWLTGTVEGEIYGISSTPRTASYPGWSVDVEFMKQYGFTEEDFACDFWEMDELFAEIFEKNGNEPFLYIDEGIGGAYGGTSTIKQTLPGVIEDVTGSVYSRIGGFYAIDPTGDTPRVINMLDTDIARKIQQAAIRYIAAGYMTKDSGDWKNGTWVSAQKKAVIRYDSSDANADEVKILRFPVAFGTGARGSSQMTGVAAVSQHKNEALMLLNLIAEDEAFREHLFVGKEGRDYTVTDGVYAPVKREDDAYYRMDFLSPLSRFSETLASEYFYLPTAEGKTKLQTYVDKLDAVETVLISVPFTNAQIKEEWAAVGEAVNKYFWTFLHFVDVKTPRGVEPAMTEERYGQMLQDIQDAGGDVILAELQRQLDEWLANNPDWETQIKPAA